MASALGALLVPAGLLAPQVIDPPASSSPVPVQPWVFPTATSEVLPTAQPTAAPTTVPVASPTSTVTTAMTPTQMIEAEPTQAVDSLPTAEPLYPHNLGRTILPMDEDYHSQLTETNLPNACGPTSLLMVLDYYGLEKSLEVVIAHHQEIPAAEGGYDPTCTVNGVCTSPDALVQVAESVYGLGVDARQGGTFTEVQNAILEGHPIIADVNWRLVPGNFGHFVVIYGVDASDETIYYHDPYDGSHRTATWAQFSAAWDGPIDVGDPLQPEGHRLWGVAIIAQ